jgi:hypothetical protein
MVRRVITVIVEDDRVDSVCAAIRVSDPSAEIDTWPLSFAAEAERLRLFKRVETALCDKLRAARET